MRVKLRLRTGDKAMLVGAAAIAVYELVVEDDDLITRRCQAYRSTPVGRILFDTWLIVTAMHLVDALPTESDPYHWAMRFRRNVGGQE